MEGLIPTQTSPEAFFIEDFPGMAHVGKPAHLIPSLRDSAWIEYSRRLRKKVDEKRLRLRPPLVRRLPRVFHRLFCRRVVSQLVADLEVVVVWGVDHDFLPLPVASLVRGDVA